MSSRVPSRGAVASRRLAARVSIWLVALAVAGSAFAIGAVHTITLCVVTLVLAAGSAFAWCGAEPIRVRPVATLLLLAAIALTGFTALQCVPMPVAWLAWLAPNAADIWSRALTPLRESGPSWAPLSLDPTATRVEVLKGTAYVLALVAALRATRTREGVSFLSLVVVATGVCLALAAVLHPAFGVKRVFGVYDPADPQIAARHIAPLLNPNHLAGYLNISFCLALAAAVSPSQRVPRTLSAAAAVFLAGVQVWVASRGGVVAMIVGGLLVLGLTRASRLERTGDLSWPSLASGFAIVAGAVMVTLAGSEEASTELFDSDVTKIGQAMKAMKVALANPVFGVGRGAFETTFPRYRDGAGYVTCAYPENVVVQWMTEWGIGVAVCAFVALGFALRPRSALARSTTAAGAWAGLVALVVQNLADFSLEVPGIALAAVTCAAIVVGGSAGRAPRYGLEKWSGVPFGVAIGSVAVALAASCLVLPGLGHEVRQDRAALYEAVVRDTPQAEFRALARPRMLRHPSEPYFPFAGALRAARARDESPLPWLEGTLERAHIYGPAHLLLAQVLGARASAQARLEYRTAVEQDAELFPIVAREAPRLVSNYNQAMDLVSAGAAAPRMLETLVATLQERLPATCVLLDRDLLARTGPSVSVWSRRARDAVADLQAGEAAPWCLDKQRGSCIRDGLAAAERLELLQPGECAPLTFKAMAMAEAGDALPAMDSLERGTDAMKDPPVCLQTLANIARASGHPERAEAALLKIARTPCAEDAGCASTLMSVATQFEQMGRPREALAVSERAREHAPDDEGILIAVARLASSTGEHAKALRYYEDLARQHPADERWRQAIEAQRDAALRGAFDL